MSVITGIEQIVLVLGWALVGFAILWLIAAIVDSLR